MIDYQQLSHDSSSPPSQINNSQTHQTHLSPIIYPQPTMNFFPCDSPFPYAVARVVSDHSFELQVAACPRARRKAKKTTALAETWMGEDYVQ
jgi:hypothetical protein